MHLIFLPILLVMLKLLFTGVSGTLVSAIIVDLILLFGSDLCAWCSVDYLLCLLSSCDFSWCGHVLWCSVGFPWGSVVWYRDRIFFCICFCQVPEDTSNPDILYTKFSTGDLKPCRVNLIWKRPVGQCMFISSQEI